ncbi:hypothetical protein DFH09DRAFT_1079687 [Mycena vulgaris]|nr:hypothetical protein DFH09DRAFT_1079687 [Mycena vulgaris]
MEEGDAGQSNTAGRQQSGECVGANEERPERKGSDRGKGKEGVWCGVTRRDSAVIGTTSLGNTAPEFSRALEIQMANRMGVDRGGCHGFKEDPQRKRSKLLHKVYRKCVRSPRVWWPLLDKIVV